ncbi:MAG: metalloregulator ArsR/SmtB family transcription factor [Chloroflexota bacterium]
MNGSEPINLMRKDARPTSSVSDCCTSSAGLLRIKTEEISSSVRLLSALADPTRLGIVTMLSGLDEPLCVCDIVTQFDLGQPTISHHLKVLREVGLVGCEKRGLWVYYWLNRDVFSGVTAYLNNLQRITSGSLAL